MKSMLFISLLLPIACLSQNMPVKEGKVFYEMIDSVTGATKTDLFNRSKIWFVNSFNSANAVLQLDDKETGQLMGKALSNFDNSNFMSGPSFTSVHYTINIAVKDGKFRIQIYDIYVSNSGNAVTYIPEYLMKYPKMNKKKIERIDECAKNLMESYKSVVVKPVNDNF